MPNLARKLVVFAAVDGLILQPLASKKDQRPPPPVKIRYGDATLSTVHRDLVPGLTKPNSSFEAFGIVGASDEDTCPVRNHSANTSPSQA